MNAYFHELFSAAAWGKGKSSEQHNLKDDLPCRGGMCHDVTADGFLFVSSIWASSSIWIGHDLIRHHYRDAELGNVYEYKITATSSPSVPHLLAVVTSARIFLDGFDEKIVHLVH
jgi:hypothetical protein